jgi:ABC-2 type transport system permease protein
VLGWVVGVWAMGLMFGSFSESIENMVADNPTLEQYFEAMGGGSVVDAFFATALLLMGILAAGFAVSSALRTRAEESADRLEFVLATAVSRPRWLLGSLLVTLVGTTLVVAAGGLGVGMSYAATTGGPSEVWRMTGYALAYLPAVLVLAALAGLLIGWFPRASGVAWAALALCFVVGYLGNLLELPAAVMDISPFTVVPDVPMEKLAVFPLAGLTLLALAGVVVGLVGFRRRDIAS